MTLRNATQWLFWLAAAFAFAMAIAPTPPQLVDIWDKLQHMLAFAVLAGLAAMAYPRFPALKLFAGLSAFGAIIEVVQAIPQLHRDSDPMDWVADTIAVGVALVALSWIRSRGRTAGPGSR
jgi:hypothetical protein